MFAPSFSYGGPPRSALGIAKGLRAIGQDVAVLASNGNGSTDLNTSVNCWTEYQGIPVIYIKRYRTNNYFFAPSLANEIKKILRNDDVVIMRAVWTYFNYCTTSILKKCHIQYLEYVLGSFDDWALHYHGFKKRIYWKLIEQECFHGAAGILALSQSEKDQVKEMSIQAPICVVPNGIDFETLDQTVPSISNFISDLADKKYILYMGRLHPKKGIESLLHAFQLVHQKLPDIRLVVAGSGEPEYERFLSMMVNDLELGKYVIFPGFVTDGYRLALLHSAYLFTLPSFSEGLPMGVLEALGCGIPVVITPECYLPEVQTAQAGCITKNDPEPLANTIISIMMDAKGREKMSRNAYSLARNHYTWADSAKLIVDFTNAVKK